MEEAQLCGLECSCGPVCRPEPQQPGSGMVGPGQQPQESSLTPVSPLPLQALYMFYALAIVCDDFFVPSLEKICEVRGTLWRGLGLGALEDVHTTGGKGPAGVGVPWGKTDRQQAPSDCVAASK